jgi:hypothetical protein
MGNMSSGQTTSKDTWDLLKEILQKTQAEVRKQIDQATPVVQRTVGSSVEAANRGFNATMKSISSHTEKEQLELLRAYRNVLSGQSQFVDSRVKALEERARAKSGASQG